MRSLGVRTFILACGMLLPLLAGQALAQSAPGTIRGQVTDPSGAVVPNISVIATPAPGQPGQAKAATVGKDGTYEIKGLVPGTYTVSAVVQGFARFQQRTSRWSAACSTVGYQAPD